MDLVHELCPVQLLEVTKKSDNLSGWLTSIQHLAHILAFISLFLCFGEQLQNMWQSLCQSQNFYWGHWQWLIVVWKCPGSVLVCHTFTVPNPNQWWFDLEFLWRLLWSHLHCDENYTKSVWAVDCNLWPWITTQSREHLDLVTSNHTLCLLWT